MAFTIDKFGQTRPFLYHLTATRNLKRLARSRLLVCAASIMTAASETSLLRTKRSNSQEFNIDGDTIHVRDQSPLYEGNIRFGDGWSFTQLIEDLNRRVFFWPGADGGPISYGMNHFERYRREKPSIIRVSFNELIARNPAAIPLFCKFNSGAPRCSNGLGSFRSQDTFVPAHKATFTAGAVVEVTFVGSIELPELVQVSNTPVGPWRKFV